MTSPKLIDVHKTRCDGCGTPDTMTACVHGHSDVYARDWRLCMGCLQRVAAIGPQGSYIDMGGPPDTAWLERRENPHGDLSKAICKHCAKPLKLNAEGRWGCPDKAAEKP